MNKPFEKSLSDKYAHLAFLFEEVKYLSQHLDFEIYEDWVYIFTTPEKGDPREEDSLKAMDEVQDLVRDYGLLPQPLYRNTLEGDRIDGVRILLPVVPPQMRIEAFTTTLKAVH